ncbi:hypothetical protein LR48_Vigan08g079800 [Vigna angularis]|uniref:Uncharacterized protein n=1 Tax=Phaseolus angularis TaxID=3914 RepID=A0A0L9V4Q4_PHAAN|nr:hypothetical protein LR48_Vigan08g079800 [Vigna angularis]
MKKSWWRSLRRGVGATDEDDCVIPSLCFCDLGFARESFLEVSYGFASNDVSDVMETERINIEKTVLDSNSRPAGTEFRSGTVTNAVKHDDEVDGESDEGSFSLTTLNFDNYVNQ